MAGCFECGNGTSGSIKYGVFSSLASSLLYGVSYLVSSAVTSEYCSYFVVNIL